MILVVVDLQFESSDSTHEIGGPSFSGLVLDPSEASGPDLLQGVTEQSVTPVIQDDPPGTGHLIHPGQVV